MVAHKVIEFDANSGDVIRELCILQKIDTDTDADAEHDRIRPVVVTTYEASVGVNFYPRCFVILDTIPTYAQYI